MYNESRASSKVSWCAEFYQKSTLFAQAAIGQNCAVFLNSDYLNETAISI